MVPYATFGHPALYTKGTQLIYIRNVNKYICPTRRTKTNEERYLYNTYNRIAYDKFVARPMKNGSRPAAERVAQRAVARIKVREMIESLALIGRSIRRAKPLVCGSAAHKGRRARVAPIPSDKGRRLAIQWTTQGAKKRSERGMALCIYLELLAARAKQGYAIKKNDGLPSEAVGSKG